MRIAWEMEHQWTKSVVSKEGSKLRFRWFVVLAAAIVLDVGAALPVAQAVSESGKDCIYIDVNGSPYYAPCSGNEVVPSGIPPASPAECVPVPGIPCP